MSNLAVGEARTGRLWRAAFVVAAIAVAGAAPGIALDASRFALANLVAISPMLLLGILLTAGATATGSVSLVAAAFEGRQVHMILAASLVGALTPVCGVSVLPLVAGLLAGGVPLAPIMAFWLSSPVTDPAMLTVTAATLGTAFAVAKTAAAFGIGVLGGLVTLTLVETGHLRNQARQARSLPGKGDACCTIGPSTVRWEFWKDPGRRRSFTATALDTGRLTAVWLSIAFVGEFLLRRYVPEPLVASLVGGDSPWAVPLAAMVGAPIYLDGYAALPLIRGLLDSGMRPDAAMAFLIAGGITSAWAAIPVFALVRLPAFVLYLALAVGGSMLAGWLAGAGLS